MENNREEYIEVLEKKVIELREQVRQGIGYAENYFSETSNKYTFEDLKVMENSIKKIEGWEEVELESKYELKEGKYIKIQGRN
jgi:tRNA U34 5-carboxymethylaminomethyl modifying GTPase MnmE/TrmE